MFQIKSRDGRLVVSKRGGPYGRRTLVANRKKAETFATRQEAEAEYFYANQQSREHWNLEIREV
jgi:hypothetical protein